MHIISAEYSELLVGLPTIFTTAIRLSMWLKEKSAPLSMKMNIWQERAPF